MAERQHTINIRVIGEDRASGPLGTVGGALGRIAEFAIGGLLVRGIEAIGRGLSGLAGQAIQSASELQNLTLGLETLAAREIARGDVIEEVATSIRHLTEEEHLRLDTLRVRYHDLTQQVADATSAYHDMAAAHGAESIEALAASVQLRELQGTLGSVGAEMDGLASAEGALVTQTRQVRVNTMTLDEAMGMAGGRAQELLTQLRDLSLVSPFEYRQVADTFRLQMAFGATSDVALDLTRAILDTSAALGLESEAASRLAYNFGQIQMVGRITGVDLRQLRMVGLDLADVFDQQLSMSIDDVNSALESGRLTMADVSQAFIEYADQNFGGAAERMSRTFTGLRSSIRDLFFFAGAELVTPALEQITELLGGVFDEAQGLVESGVLARIGEQIGESIGNAIETVQEIGALIAGLRSIYEKGGAEGVGRTLIDMLVPPDQAERAKEVFSSIYSGVTEVVPQIVDTVVSSFSTIREWFTANWPTIQAVVMTAWVVIRDVVLSVVDVIVGSVWPQLQAAFDSIGSVLADLGITWGDVWNAVKAAVATVAAAIGAILLVLVGIVVGVVNGIAGGLRLFAVVWHEVVSQARGVFEGLVRYFLSMYEAVRAILTGDWPRALQMLGEAWRAQFQVIGNLLGLIVNAIGLGFRVAYGVIRGFVEGVVGFFRNLYDRLVGHSIVPEMMSAIVDTIRDGLQNGIEAVRGFIGRMVSAGRDLLNGLRDGILGAVDGLISAVRNAVERALGAARGLLGIESPSRVFFEIGQRTIEGFAAGIHSLAALPALEVQAVAGRAAAAATPSPAASGRQQVTIYGGLTLEGVQDAPGLLEQLQALSAV